MQAEKKEWANNYGYCTLNTLSVLEGICYCMSAEYLCCWYTDSLHCAGEQAAYNTLSMIAISPVGLEVDRLDRIVFSMHTQSGLAS